MPWLLLVKIEFLLAKCDGLEITATCLYLVWQNCHILHPVNYQQMELRIASLGIETLSPRQKRETREERWEKEEKGDRDLKREGGRTGMRDGGRKEGANKGISYSLYECY